MRSEEQLDADILRAENSIFPFVGHDPVGERAPSNDPVDERGPSNEPVDEPIPSIEREVSPETPVEEDSLLGKRNREESPEEGPSNKVAKK